MVAPTTPRLTLRELRTSAGDAVRPDRGDRRNDPVGGGVAAPLAVLDAVGHPALGPREARIKRVRLPVDTRMVDDQDEVDEFEFEDEFEDEGYESLRDRVRRGPILGVLLGTTLFAGAVWVVLNSITHIRQANLIRQASVYPDIFSSESENELWVWMQAASGIAYGVFLVALGSYVVLWLALREESN